MCRFIFCNGTRGFSSSRIALCGAEREPLKIWGELQAESHPKAVGFQIRNETRGFSSSRVALCHTKRLPFKIWGKSQTVKIEITVPKNF